MSPGAGNTVTREDSMCPRVLGKSETLTGFHKRRQLTALSITSTWKNAANFGSGQRGPGCFGFSLQHTRGMGKRERKRTTANIITERLGRLPSKIVAPWTVRNTSKFLLVFQTVDKCSCGSQLTANPLTQSSPFWVERQGETWFCSSGSYSIAGKTIDTCNYVKCEKYRNSVLWREMCPSSAPPGNICPCPFLWDFIHTSGRASVIYEDGLLKGRAHVLCGFTSPALGSSGPSQGLRIVFVEWLSANLVSAVMRWRLGNLSNLENSEILLCHCHTQACFMTPTPIYYMHILQRGPKDWTMYTCLRSQRNIAWEEPPLTSHRVIF